MSCIMIGVAGGSGSGKSTFTNRLKNEFGDRVTVIYHDNYYKSNDGIPFEVRQKENYDHPDAFETDLLITHLKALRRGETVQCPIYDYAEHNRTKETTELKPSKIIIVEGILVLENPELRSLFELRYLFELRCFPQRPPFPPSAAGCRGCASAFRTASPRRHAPLGADGSPRSGYHTPSASRAREA